MGSAPLRSSQKFRIEPEAAASSSARRKKTSKTLMIQVQYVAPKLIGWDCRYLICYILKNEQVLTWPHGHASRGPHPSGKTWV